MKRMTLALMLGFALIASAEAKPAARDQYTALQSKAQDALAAKNWPIARAALQELREFLHGSTRVTYDLARVEAISGDKDEAFRLLNTIAATHQYIDVTKDPDLASLQSDPRFAQLASALKKNLEPIAHSTTAYTIGDPELLTEDITYDPQTRSFFITSVLRKTITRIDTVRNKLSLFADFDKDPGWPLMAIAADPKRRVVWVTAAALPDFVASPPAAYGKSVLLKLDLKSARILDRFSPSDSEQHTMGDMTLMRDGSAIVCDSRGGAVFRLRPGSSKLERIDAGEFISPQTPTLSADEKYAFIPDYARGIGRIDLTSGAVTWIEHSDDTAVSGIDGMYMRGQDLYAIQNGANPARLMRFHLNAALDRIDGMDILESNSPGLGDPTHGVFVGNEFYFIANSGWSELDEHGSVKPGHQLSETTIRKLEAK
jgi:sugar lactone lactonase YvrE